ncbi:MAG: hypothetical protein KIT58_04340 [Planctomycetota bacterium]|nr:hypothetical protein [Planctomycetota bacterium]
MSRSIHPTAERPLVRLDTLPLGGGRLAVERAFPGKIKNVSIVTTGPALGHGFTIDRTTVEQVARHAPGMRGRWTHGGLCEDGLGRHLGAWQNLRLESFRLCRACEAEAPSGTTACAGCQQPTTEEWRAVGDFAFAASAHKVRPDGLDVPAPVYLMDRAAEDPRSLGISIVARLDCVEEKAEGQEAPRRLARLASKHDLRRGDWVADPAANPLGLHEGTGAPSGLVELATRELDRLAAREGAAAAKLRALAFLARHFGDDVEAQGELERLEAEVEALRAQVSRLEAAAETRREADDRAYLESLRRVSAEVQAPIPEKDLEQVAALLRAGQGALARTVGDAFLARSRAEGQARFHRKDPASLQPEEPAPAPEQASVEVQAHALRRRGWTVEIGEDGTITRKTPPGERSRA